MTQEIINLDYKFTNLFPMTLHQLQIDEFENKKRELVEFAYNLVRDKPHYQRLVSNKNGGLQSEVYEVKGDNFLESLIFNIIKSVPVFNDKVTFKSFYWVNVNPPGAYNVKHCHPNSNIAGVLWLKAPKKSGDIVFISPNDYTSFIELCSYTEEFRKQTYNYHSYRLPPKEGNVILFPSYLQHRVDENFSNDDRISVSFNIKITHEDYIASGQN